MAKRRRNKSKLIRGVLELNPRLGNSEVIAELKKRKVTVTQALVGNVRARMAAGSSGQRASKARAETFSVQALVEARKIADRLGGIEKAAAVFKLLAELSG